MTWSRIALATGSASALLASSSAQCTLDVEPIGIAGVSGGNQSGIRSFVEWDPDGAGPAGPVLVMCGDFNRAGTVFADDVATFDPVTGQWGALPGLPAGETEVAFVDAGGNLLIGGWYGLRRWDGASWVIDVPIVGRVAALAEDNAGNLLIAGSINSVGGVAVNNIASWDGAVATSVGPAAPGSFNDFITDIAVRPNGEIVVAGYFVAAASVAAGAAWFDGAAWNPFPFQPNAITSATAVETLPNGDVAIALRRGASRRIEVWDGTQLTILGFADGTVQGLELDADGNLFAGGDFTTMSGVATGSVARFDGASWSEAGTGLYFTGFRELLSVQSGDLFVTPLNGGVQRLTAGAWRPIELGLGAQGSPYEVRALLTRANGNVVAGGILGSAGVRFDIGGVAELEDGAWLPLDGGLAGQVNALAEMPNGDLIAGGRFQATDAGLSASNIARYDGAQWNAVGQGLGATFQEVRALETMTNGDLIAGGYFTVIGASPVNHLARFDGTSWSALAGGVTLAGSAGNAAVNALAEMPNGDLIVAGFFDNAGGVAAPGIARLSGSTWSTLGTATFAGSVKTLLVQPNGDLIAGGSFTVGGFIQNVARFDGSNWTAVGNSLPFPVASLVRLYDGDIVASGDNGELEVLDGAAWQSLVAAPTMGSIEAFTTVDNGEVIAGGSITELDGSVTALLARLNPSCVPSVTSIGAGCNGQTLTAITDPLVGSPLVTEGANLPASGFAWSVYSLSPGFGGAVPLGAFFPEALDSCFGYVPPDASFIIPLDPNGDPIESTLAIPDNPVFAGTVISTQMIIFETDATGTISTVTSTDALLAVIGLD